MDLLFVLVRIIIQEANRDKPQAGILLHLRTTSAPASPAPMIRTLRIPFLEVAYGLIAIRQQPHRETQPAYQNNGQKPIDGQCAAWKIGKNFQGTQQDDNQ